MGWPQGLLLQTSWEEQVLTLICGQLEQLPKLFLIYLRAAIPLLLLMLMDVL